MNIEQLIDQGNQHRANREYEQALQCYATAFVADRNSASAFNNYGNVLREMGYPRRAIPFIESAIDLAPNNVTAQFNLAVCYLLMSDYGRGWPQYETRWRYEHLAAATGRPTWIMLNRYSTDWRWLLDKSDSPWYPTVRLFRQQAYGEWQPVTDQVAKFLSWFKI